MYILYVYLYTMHAPYNMHMFLRTVLVYMLLLGNRYINYCTCFMVEHIQALQYLASILNLHVRSQVMCICVDTIFAFNDVLQTLLNKS